MDTTVQVLITVAGTIVVSAIGCFGLIKVGRVEKTTDQIQNKTGELEIKINSKMDMLIKLIGESKFAEGKLAGQNEERAQNALVAKTKADLLEAVPLDER